MTSGYFAEQCNTSQDNVSYFRSTIEKESRKDALEANDTKIKSDQAEETNKKLEIIKRTYENMKTTINSVSNETNVQRLRFYKSTSKENAQRNI